MRLFNRLGSLTLALALTGFIAEASETYHVRPDGGDQSICSGLSPDPKTSSNRNCAWSHPFIALPPGGQPRITGGDRLIIHRGVYHLGVGAPGSENCSVDWPWDCHMPPVPSGVSVNQPTRITGVECRHPPQLIGIGRASHIFDLTGSTDLQIQCLEITDAAECIQHHCHGGRCSETARPCPRSGPDPGKWAAVGITARDSERILLRNLYVHGLAVAGIRAGRIRDWTLDRVRIRTNGWAGWDGDIGEDSANSGTLRFIDVEIAYNGCFRAEQGADPEGCWAQETGGYGDGLGTGSTGGTWLFERVKVTGNTSDGIDLLYLRAPGSVIIRNSEISGNAGNQIKISGSAQIQTSKLNGRCDQHEGIGQMQSGDLCRAGGDAMVFKLHPGDRVSVRDSRVTGNGDCLVVTHGGDETSRLEVEGNHLRGLLSRVKPGRRTCGIYLHSGSPRSTIRGNQFTGVRESACRPGNECRQGQP